MASFLTENLTTLELLDSSLAGTIAAASVPGEALVTAAPSGDPTLTMMGRSFHSRIDPRAEAEALASSAVIMEMKRKGFRPAIFGLGLGYHALALAAGFDQVLVIEPDPGMIKLAFIHLDFRSALSGMIFVLDRSATAGWPLTALLPHPPSVRRWPREFEYWADRLTLLPPAGRNGPRDTIAHLKKSADSLDGLADLLSGYPENGLVGHEDLAARTRSRTGLLTETEIYLLLLEELAPARKDASGRIFFRKDHYEEVL
ncbi:MAG: hypothetical protein AB1641_10670 [Thermodesulfobacteriota bacterium]